MEPTKPDLSVMPSAGFSGSTLVLDPATGFLTAPDTQATGKQENGRGMLNANGYANGPLSVFVASKKVEFLSFLMELFPDYSECSKRVGITRATFKNHYAVDAKFRACVDEIRDSFVDRIERKRFELSIQDKGALDRMAVLNAYRRETYNPSIDVNVRHEMSLDEAQIRSGRLGKVIDAQIVAKVKEDKRLRDSNE